MFVQWWMMLMRLGSHMHSSWWLCHTGPASPPMHMHTAYLLADVAEDEEGGVQRLHQRSPHCQLLLISLQQGDDRDGQASICCATSIRRTVYYP